MGGRRHPEQTLTCPSCETRFHSVIDTRYAVGTIKRRRLCVKGHDFTTTETVDANESLDTDGILRSSSVQ